MNDLRTADLKGKRVLYAVDYNIPMLNGEIRDDSRILATQQTIDYLIEKGAKIIIATYIGRPEGKVVPEFELRPIAERLADLYPDHVVQLAHKIDDPEVGKAIERMNEGDILILPNVRFFPEEETNNEQFGHMMSSLADIYVNDAFAHDHRVNASVVAPPKYLPSYPGFLLESELKNLGELLSKPERPFVVVMGGAKVSDKIEVIKSLTKICDKLLVGGALANTFLFAKGEDVSESKVEKEKVDLAEKLIEEMGDKLVLAKDYVKDEMEDGKFRYLDIGEEAVAEFKEILKDAKTIFWNGSLGYTEDPRFMKASQEIAEYIGSLKEAKSIIAGGDTDELITRLKMRDQFTFISTGGGAALDLLAGKPLPGVEALEQAKKES
jgi:phosphoglycerate kinase